MITLAKIDKRISDDGKSWVTISRAVQEADLILLEKRIEKVRKQMLWKRGRSVK